MKNKIKVTYYIDNDIMTDDEFQNQEEKEFIITEQMIYDLVMQNDSKIIHMQDTIDITDIRLL